jgi:preprotein translocase subunit SecB
MSQDLEKARSLISVVQLESVRLVQASARAGIRTPEEAPDVKIFLDYSATGSKADDHRFFVLASIEVAVAATPDDKNPAILVKAKFELSYRVPEDFKISKQEIVSFANVNGIYNAWPYFREFVQSSTARMDLPGVVLPVFRVPASKKAKTAPNATKKA